MSQNRPTSAPISLEASASGTRPSRLQPTIGMVSLGCPRRWWTANASLTRCARRLRDLPITRAPMQYVNTCGFLDQRQGGIAGAIGEALTENTASVIVTGCLAAPTRLLHHAEHTPRAAVTGPHQYEAASMPSTKPCPPKTRPVHRPAAASAVSLTPPTTGYLKISKACNTSASLIIPDMRGLCNPAPPMPCCARRKSWSKPACANCW